MTAAGPPIHVLYIANRGEIAARIARTADALGITAVAAEVAGPDAVDLLDPASVVAAARAAGADALHPGYGFLAENAGFADAVVAAGLRWVGPPADAMRAMGDKAAARRVAHALGVPTLPGYDDEDQTDAALVTAAAGAIGFPLLVKPSGGGGGKGMRVVRAADALPAALAGARREARAAFGDDRLILERFVEGPRHVEIQVLFDTFGAGVSLGERDCSLQRRQQKVLEESPSPAVDAALRERLGDAAVRLAATVRYASAGTVEFLLDDDGAFWFLEMNTRLQVEHPVTEAVTGRDLVADQLRIAAGERLAAVLNASLAGGSAPRVLPAAAVEVRLYAEDADAGFLPATGRIVEVTWPTGDGIRVDAGIAVRDEVSGRFDPLLAKLIASGASRAEALDRLTTALDQTSVLGVVTNLRFLRWVVRQPVVRSGEVRIDTLDRIWPPDDWAARTAIPDSLWTFAAARLATGTDSDAWRGGWRLNAPATVTVAADGTERRVEPDPTATAPGGWVATDGAVVVDLLGQSVEFRLAPPPDVYAVGRAGAGGAVGAADVRSPMPGAVLVVHVAVGTAVAAGQPLLTIEAMKMEHVVAAPIAGSVAAIFVAAGDQVVKGQPVAVVAPDGSAPRE
jgi:acetyl-CoA/propionyl-CoA carboxylase biotin carboxyl carrier protein